MTTWRFNAPVAPSTGELYKRARRIKHLSLDDCAGRMANSLEEKLPQHLRPPFSRAVHSLWSEVEHVFTLKPFSGQSAKDEDFYRWQMQRKFDFYANPYLSEIEEHIWSGIGYIAVAMPPTHGPLRTAAINLIPYGRDLIHRLQGQFSSDLHCYRTHRRIAENFAVVNGIPLAKWGEKPKKKIVTVENCPFDVRTTLDKFLGNTVFHDLLTLEV